MRIVELEQNTPEWEEFRRTRIGASDVPTIMDGSDNDRFDLYVRKTSGSKLFVNRAMERGHELEPDARAWYETVTGYEFPKLTACHDDHDWLMASLDGYSEPTQEVLEIKCPMDIPDEAIRAPNYNRYWWQVQAQMGVSGARNAALVLYSPEKQVVQPIQRDDAAIERLIESGKQFMKYLKEEEEYPIPFEERLDTDWFDAAQELKEIREKKKEIEEKEAIVKEALIYLSGEKSCRGNGVSVSREVRRGRVDYTKIPQLKDVDLEVYRKPTSVCCVVRVS